jgi:hypothetical protein
LAAETAEVPTWVTYGPAAARGEGDPDSYRTLYFSLPAEQREAVYLRIFDGDTGGAFDTAFGRFGETRTRFALYSGPQAFPGHHRVLEASPETK